MRSRGAVTVATIAFSVATAGCGGSTKTVTTTVPGRPVTTSSTGSTPSSDEVLAVPTVGGFYARCPQGAPIWTLRFVAADSATDAISFKLGSGPAKHASVNPGNALTFRLVPNSARTHEPASQLPRLSATTVATTPPLTIEISQGTEPQFLRVDVHLALTTIAGESGRCALAGSSLSARTYPTSAP
jgi:hypothetical protein